MNEYYIAMPWGNLIRSELCSAGVAFGMQAMWRSPRNGFRYGGLQFGFLVTIFMLFVALPVVLLQIAVGRLSKQDAVGIWKAVPFFKGIGYIKLLISAIISIYTVIYVSLTIIYFVYGINNSLPFAECSELYKADSGDSINASACLEETYMSSYSKNPEYFINLSLITSLLWAMLPLLFYNPIKLIKRIMYALSPIVIILSTIIVFSIGNTKSLTSIWNQDWAILKKPYIWHAALVQALLSSQVAGGYLLSAGEAIYSNTDIHLSVVLYIGTHILSTWVGLLFWYAVSVSDTAKDTTVHAVLIETYKIGEQVSTNSEWPILIFFILILSGFLSLITNLFPIYDHCRHVAGRPWRRWAVGASLVCALLTLGLVALRSPFITLLEDYAIPLLVSISVIPELLALLLIYDWRALLQDIEFLSGRLMSKTWAVGMSSTPLLLTPVTVWWFTAIYLNDKDWAAVPLSSITLIVSVGIAILVFFIFATVVIARQVQYDLFGKLKSSFKPSRQWGPQDPITHYYWLASKQEFPSSRYNGRRVWVPKICTTPKYLDSNNINEKNSNTKFGSPIQHKVNLTEHIGIRRPVELNNSNETLKDFKKAAVVVDLAPSNKLS